MPTQVSEKLINWASDIEDATLEQAARTSRLPIIQGHVALMPDAHFGIGSTVGSVVPTKGAIIPACVGVDIGCGMVAVATSLKAVDLPDSLDGLMSEVEQAVPAGMGMGHEENNAKRNAQWHRFTLQAHTHSSRMTEKQSNTAFKQFGSLGGGNHFVEVGIDEVDNVWLVLHSGSRGIGNQLAEYHIKKTKGLDRWLTERLEDDNLAYLLEGEQGFQDYIADMLWAQDYAFANRQAMVTALMPRFFKFVGKGAEVKVINTHHNFTQKEMHGGQSLWITRKGAISAKQGELGIIPGSMGTATYIVEGKGNPDSYCSCSHGAGRRLGRKAAERAYSPDDLAEQMKGITWNASKGDQLVDEIPTAYKDIHQVIADSADLVTPLHTLRQVLNYKGIK